MTNRVVRLFLFSAAVASLSCTAMAGVVGSGTPSSCTEAALAAQLSAGGTITFNCGTGPQTIAFASTLFIVAATPKVTIDGNDTITLNGTGNTSGMVAIFGDATSLPDVTFKHITFTNGNITTGLLAGGAIQNFGKLTLDTVVFTNNHASGGGVVFQEPCTGCLDPSLTVTHCLFQNNTAGSGGAIDVEGGSATIADSTFSGNSAPTAGAIDVYGNSTFKVIVSIDRCTFIGNSATFIGGAIAAESFNPGSSLTITNDTFTGNSATGATGQGAAIYLAAAPVTITNCTIAGNTAHALGGAVYFDNRTPVTAVNNTIIASNSGGNCAFAGGSTFTGGHNLQFGDTTCSLMTVANPLLGALTNNGGPTQTMALSATSPAIDAADTALAPSTDQRGSPRTDGNDDGHVAADIGSFEAPAAASPTQFPQRHHAVR